MKQFWRTLKAIFFKDVLIELKAIQVLPTMIVLGLLITGILRIVFEASSVDARVFAPAALWIAFLFSGFLAQERCFAVERQSDCIYGLLLAPVDPGTIYLAKFLVNVVILCFFELIIVPAVCISFNLPLPGRLMYFVLVLLLVNFGISSVGTLFSAIVQLTGTRTSLLGILILAVLLPMMLPATFALLVLFEAVPAEIVGSGSLGFVGTFESAVGYLVAFDAVFVVTCWLLSGFAMEE